MTTLYWHYNYLIQLVLNTKLAFKTPKTVQITIDKIYKIIYYLFKMKFCLRL